MTMSRVLPRSSATRTPLCGTSRNVGCRRLIRPDTAPGEWRVGGGRQDTAATSPTLQGTGSDFSRLPIRGAAGNPAPRSHLGAAFRSHAGPGENREWGNASSDRPGGPLADPATRRPTPELVPRGLLPYREATELQECIRLMDDEEFCRREVLGVCTPGPRRDVALQPVFFRSADNDPSPTGTSWGARLGAANTIWGKLGVSFTANSPVLITDPVNKVAGGSAQERTAIRALHSGPGIEVFMMDNDLPAPAGGGATTPRQGGDASKVVLSDRGASRTLLAHELGHVLGLGHPPGGADADTIMQPSGSHASENPWRNTLGNLQRVTWPQASGIACIDPDA